MPLANADLHGGAVEAELSEKFGKAVPMRQAEPMLGERPAEWATNGPLGGEGGVPSKS